MINLKQQWFSWSKPGKIGDFYDVDTKKVLGSGTYGQVIRVKQKGTKVFRAIRIIPKIKVKNQERLKKELNQLRQINNEFVIKIYDCYEDARNLYIVMDLCEGGALYEKILERHVLSAYEARSIFVQIASAVQACHRFGICHRDLRPESFLYVSRKGDDINIRSTDFGFSLLYSDDYIKKQKGIIIETSRHGKLYYVAPEIFEGRCNESCDIWSLGVILHVLLTGELPFQGESDDEILQNIQNIQLSLKVEDLPADLIAKMLQSQDKRIQFINIMKHPWFTANIDQNLFLNVNFKQLKALSQQNQLKKIMMNFISESVQQEQVDQFAKQLELQDEEGSGYLRMEQIKQTVQQTGAYSEFLQLLQQLQQEDGLINYLEFINQIQEKRLYLKEERIFSAFKHFDLNATGRITRDNLWKVLITNEQFTHITKEFCSSLIDEVDKNNDGEIDYMEFIEMFFKKT